MARIVITGIAGCIGSWVAKHLLEDGHDVVGLDLAERHPNAALLGIQRVPVERLDVGDRDAFAGFLREAAPDGVVHLVSLLMPTCRDRPGLCVDVNVQSFMTVLEAARELSFSVAYASSAWVQKPPPDDRPVAEEDGLEPQSLYGVFKLANEGMARLYARDYGVRCNGLRPYIVYGPGRVGGLTADINLALLAAARGEAYRIGFGGGVALHHASDVAALFARLAIAPTAAGRVYNVRGSVCDMAEVVDSIESVTGTRGLVSFDDRPLPIAANLSDAALQRDYGPFAFMRLREGMAATLDTYRAAGGSVA
jgi:UDP-glucuronate 4-epimerase